MKSTEQSTGCPSAERTKKLCILITLAALGLELGHIAHFATYATRTLGYPFELGYGESQIFHHTTRLLAGEEIYVPISDTHWIPSLYPPVLHVATAVLVTATGADTLLVGRSVSLGSMAWLALAVFAIVWQVTAHVADRTARLLAAGFAGLLVPTIEPIQTFAVLMRVDVLANALAFTGIWLFVRSVSRGTPPWPSFLLFVLALYTRHSMLAAPAACLLVLVLRGRLGEAARAVAATVLSSLGLLVLMHFWLGGALVEQISTLAEHRFDWAKSGALLAETLEAYAVVVALALLWGISTIRAHWRERETKNGAVRLTIALYLFTALLVSLTVGKSGADVNYFIELLAAATACAGVTLAEGLATAPERQPADLGSRISSLALPVLLLVQLTWLHPDMGARMQPPAASVWPAQDRLLQRLARTPGPILSEDLVLLTRAGKKPELAFLEMTELANAKRWDPEPFLERIEQREYSRIVTRAMLRDMITLTPEMVETIRRHYRRAGRFGSFWLYAPHDQRSRSTTVSPPAPAANAPITHPPDRGARE